jgi:hypothetical protein
LHGAQSTIIEKQFSCYGKFCKNVEQSNQFPSYPPKEIHFETFLSFFSGIPIAEFDNLSDVSGLIVKTRIICNHSPNAAHLRLELNCGLMSKVSLVYIWSCFDAIALNLSMSQNPIPWSFA